MNDVASCLSLSCNNLSLFVVVHIFELKRSIVDNDIFGKDGKPYPTTLALICSNI
jgi:hypothetical protein